ncbi:rhamnogalacturonan lyase [Sphingosinicella sp. BN140058]|uniref:rhamnogalacturonan lyase n=1 Tax=Sphingosinicella sp. BN140058 TaxID=1892855 RepID=UPI001011629B|nr:rhamnogalacturonan lyase [Sphingosinicella sp. BN140058]QAY76295.1 rhamnogalacturonan lyase [Sphingosinicella sp. BN140058]
MAMPKVGAAAAGFALVAAGAAQGAPHGSPIIAGRQAESLDRGVVAVPAIGGAGILVSWRLLASDAPGTGFAVYRDGHRVGDAPPQTGTNFVDAAGRAGARYTVRPVVGGKERAPSAAAAALASGYLSIPLQRPAQRTAPDGTAYSYDANDTSVGDLDGDGRYEIVVKWYPSIARDNAFVGYSGETLFDAYTLDGKRLWRIDMGPNIRSGAHYTQFLVYDFDGDGRAEVVAKTADGTIDGAGKPIGDPKADWRETGGDVDSTDRTGSTELPGGRRVAQLTGRILKGPEYLTVFDGRSGRALATAPYAPPRHPDTPAPSGDQLKSLWGDSYGNRSERYLAGVAYLDGKRPSIVMGRGYYARSTVAAWDYRGGRLVRRWLFDTSAPGNDRFAGQGNHQLSVADVDSDGRDEIVYGSMAIDDDGKGLWSSGLRHGDTMHLSDLDPARPGLEKWGVHEEVSRNGGIGAAMLDARTGAVLWSTKADKDTGRGLAADIDPRHPGAEAWAANSPDLYDVTGNVIGRHPRQTNFAIWWDGDLSRELLDGTAIFKWDFARGESVPLLEPAGVASNNGTKANPALSADILGDWREELVVRTEDSSALRIYVTPYPTSIRLPALMQDPVYRLGVAWQNVAYNQPPHTGYFLGTGMAPRGR